MEVSTDWTVYARLGPFSLNATLVFTWVVMLILIVLALLATWGIRRAAARDTPPRGWHNVLETVVAMLGTQIRDVTRRDPDRFLPFLATLFLFVAVSNLLAVVPGFKPPTGSLSTTTALALCVFVAVPVWGVRENGLWNFLRNYFQPTPLMLPFNIIGEFSRTLALAVRLFGNVMSGTMIAAILLIIAPLLFPVLLQLLGLLTGMVQAFIFFILATVYIGAATESHRPGPDTIGKNVPKKGGSHG